jgi:hypothetical protein
VLQVGDRPVKPLLTFGTAFASSVLMFGSGANIVWRCIGLESLLRFSTEHRKAAAMTVRKDTIRPTPNVDVNDMRDANDPIYPDTVQGADGHVHIGNRNPDAITGESGSHPVGSGLGAAAGGALAGIGLGAVAGPIGAAVGAVVGGIAGGLAGKSVAETIDPTVEDAYWRDEYPRSEYYDESVTYEEIRPAYRYGWESRARYQGRTWEQVQADLRRDWEVQQDERVPGTWEDAQRPIRDAWDRAEAQLAQDKIRHPR